MVWTLELRPGRSNSMEVTKVGWQILYQELFSIQSWNVRSLFSHLSWKSLVSKAVFVVDDTFVHLDELCISSIKTCSRSIIRLDERSFVVRRSSCTTKGSLSRRMTRLVPVFVLERHKQTNNKWLPKLVQTDNVSSSIKTASRLLNEVFCLQFCCQRSYSAESVGLLYAFSHCLFEIAKMFDAN